MIKEGQLSRVYTREPSILLRRTESVFHSQWLAIKYIYLKILPYSFREKEEITSELKDLKEIKTSKKAKAVSLENKVSAANIKDWVSIFL
jgi:hypothetical protein